MRALSHPARWRALDYLGTVDEATATECARAVGITPSAMSYHLRALAKVGMVDEADGRGDGRERLWRRKRHGFSISAGHRAPEAARAAEDAMSEAVIVVEDQRIREWLARRHDEPQEWYDASAISESAPYLTVEELAELNRKVQELLTPYEKRGRKGRPDGARRTQIVWRSFPSAD